MSTPNSSLKQSRLDFSVGKRTTSNNKNGKPSQTPSIPIEVEKKKPLGKTETIETDGYEDFILPSSDDDKDDSEAALSVDVIKPTSKKDVSTLAGRATRASTKDSAKKTPKLKEEASNDLERPRVSRNSKTKTQSETTGTKKAAVGAAPTAESKETLPELKIKDSKWTKHYIEVKNKMGLPPIHGETQNRIHEILRVFDNSYEYGPCVGVTRLERWNRAKALGLNPPKEVEEILNTKQGSTMPEYSQSVFYGEV